MKIRKIKPIEGSAILASQAELISSAGRSRDTSSEYLAVHERSAFSEAMLHLAAENVNPIARPPKIAAGTLADPTELTRFFNDVGLDLNAMYVNIQKLSEVLLQRHNIVALKEGSVIGALKTLRAKIATLKLYSRDLGRNNEYKHFSFTDADEIQEGFEMYVEEEGALTLPKESGGALSLPIAHIEIDTESDGSPGYANRLNPGLFDSGNMGFLTDSNEQTWFEYENQYDTGQRESGVRLVLNILLPFSQIVNQIRISPANLGTTAWVKIEDIKLAKNTSSKFVSIKGDIVKTEWTKDDDPFILAPANSKFAGQGVFTFLPRKASVIKITLIQNSPYQIETRFGLKKRYCIALRELQVYQIRFKEEGEFRLRDIEFNAPVRAIGFLHNQSPGYSQLGQVDYLVSSDGGQTWIDLAPLENKDSLREERLVFEAPTRSLMVKGKIKRLPEGFADFTEAEVTYSQIEKLVSTPRASTSITLDYAQKSFLEVVKAGVGTVGGEVEPTLIGLGASTPGDRTLYHLSKPIETDRLRVVVNGERWEVKPNFRNEDGTLNVTSPWVMHDPSFGNNGVLIFGDGGVHVASNNIGGRPVPIGAEIRIYQKADIPKVTLSDEGGFYEVELTEDSAKSRANTVLFWSPSVADVRLDGLAFFPTETLYTDYETNHLIPRGQYALIAVRPHSSSPSQVGYIGPISFINGQQEFTEADFGGRESGVALNYDANASYFSIDRDNHRVYINKVPNDQTYPLTFYYPYIKRYRFEGEDIHYLPYREDLKSILIIKNPLFRPRTSEIDLFNVGTDFTILNERTLHLTQRVVKGTLSIYDSTETRWLREKLKTEIDYINGATEFSLVDSQNGKYSVDYAGTSTDGEGTNICIPIPGVNAPFREWESATITASAGSVGKSRLIFQAADIEAHYMEGRPLIPNIDYFPSSKKIELSPDFILTESRSKALEKRILIRYDAALESSEEGAEIEVYYSPVIRDIAVIGITIDPRLGTLEVL
jgi:hypothetical protein